MREYRKLPHGDERICTLGLGMGGIQNAPADEIRAVIEKAIANGINFFDLCAGGKSVYEPFGKAIAPCRDRVFFRLHFGAVYNENGEYGWSRNLQTIRQTFLWEPEALGTDYVDFGFLHCVDEESDFDEIRKNGILDYVKDLHERGIVRHIGFSSHTPSVAHKVLDTGMIDMMMFPLNPAYNLECGDEYGIGTANERAALLRRAQTKGVGVSVMKPFHGGQLLSAKTSPFRQALTKNQYIRYCQPCPAGIDIGIVNKYYDLSLAGDRMAHDHYGKLTVRADACLGCGHCDRRCPFRVHQQSRMKEIAAYFNKEN